MASPADWSGLGNVGWRHRRGHLQALAVIFAKVASAPEPPSLAAARAWRPGLEQALLETFAPLLPGHALRVTRVVEEVEDDGAPARICTSFFITSARVG